jgi:large subunit ribosomal protein L29
LLYLFILDSIIIKVDKMAILRSKEIWEMEIEDIQEKLDELKSELAKNISKSAAAGINENPGKIRELKRTIARVITIISQKQKEK